MDFAAWVVTAIGRDSAAAKQAARSMVGIYASSMPHEQLERNGVDRPSWHPSSRPWAPATSPAAWSSPAPSWPTGSRSPEPPTRSPRRSRRSSREPVSHFIAAITDASLVKAFTGQTVDGVATVEELTLLAEEVIPHFPERAASRLRLRDITVRGRWEGDDAGAGHDEWTAKSRARSSTSWSSSPPSSTR